MSPLFTLFQSLSQEFGALSTPPHPSVPSVPFWRGRFQHCLTQFPPHTRRHIHLGAMAKVKGCQRMSKDPFNQWPFREPKLEVPTIYKAYVRPM